MEQDIRGHFESEVFTTVIPRNVKLSEAPSHGKPAILYDINSAGAQAYMEVASELIKRMPAPDSRASGAPLAGRPQNIGGEL